MAQLRVRSVVSEILKLNKVVFKKLKKTLLLQGRNSGETKGGHFVVIAEDGDETKRFVVPLSCLTNPTFLRLLELAEEKYGFGRDGAVTIPCRPNELEMLLERQRFDERSYSFDQVMVKCNQRWPKLKQLLR